MKNLTITVVTPSYNQGSFLAETIESVIGQEGDFFLDYLIIDGGSTDDSVAIIRRYEKQLEEKLREVKCRGIRYRWISEKDRGQTDALSKGFHLAGGEILAWLNSDDVYLPGTLQTVAAVFRNNPATALLYGDADYCDGAGKVVGRYPSGNFDFAKLAWFNFFCQPATFFKKEAFAAVGGLDSSLHFAMDYDLFVRLGKSYKVSYVPRPLAKYRLHETSKTMRNDDLFHNHEEVLFLALKYFGWAPLNRVYGSCHSYCLARLPGFLTRFRLVAIAAALLCTLPRSLWLNRGLRRQDLQLLRLANFRKIFKERMEILRG